MPRRFPASSAFALAIFLPALTRADVPPADGGAADQACTVAVQSTAGRMCADCQLTGTDTSCALELGDSYHFVCQYSPSVQVWCTGPSGTPGSSSCALRGSPQPAVPAGGAAATALLGLTAWAARRERRTR